MFGISVVRKWLVFCLVFLGAEYVSSFGFGFRATIPSQFRKVSESIPLIGRRNIVHQLSLQSPLTRSIYGNLIHRISQVEDDGYSLSLRSKAHRIKRLLTFNKKPGTLILIRHGETAMNYNSTFTGWIDTDLSEEGVVEVEHAARLLLERGYDMDVVYTSRLKRAIRSAWILLISMNKVYKAVYKSWRLNERMYGALEGLSKQEIALELGEEAVQDIRRGMHGKPPPMEPGHPHWHKNELKYSDLDPMDIPLTESLRDTMDRTIPLWRSRILPDIKQGKNVCIVAHANSLRGIVNIIEGDIPIEDVPKIVIPNGIPLVYKFDKRMKPIKQKMAVYPLNGEFLEKRGLLKAALIKEKELSMRVPGLSERNLFRNGTRYLELPMPISSDLREVTAMVPSIYGARRGMGAQLAVAAAMEEREEAKLVVAGQNSAVSPESLLSVPASVGAGSSSNSSGSITSSNNSMSTSIDDVPAGTKKSSDSQSGSESGRDNLNESESWKGAAGSFIAAGDSAETSTAGLSDRSTGAGAGAGVGMIMRGVNLRTNLDPVLSSLAKLQEGREFMNRLGLTRESTAAETIADAKRKKKAAAPFAALTSSSSPMTAPLATATTTDASSSFSSSPLIAPPLWSAAPSPAPVVEKGQAESSFSFGYSLQAPSEKEAKTQREQLEMQAKGADHPLLDPKSDPLQPDSYKSESDVSSISSAAPLGMTCSLSMPTIQRTVDDHDVEIFLPKSDEGVTEIARGASKQEGSFINNNNVSSSSKSNNNDSSSRSSISKNRAEPADAAGISSFGSSRLGSSRAYDGLVRTGVRDLGFGDGVKTEYDPRTGILRDTENTQLLIIIRHGKTEYNKLGIFTGWEDAPLAEQGRDEARRAGQLLKLHGMQFDVVYTSWLSRAIETAWLVLNELDLLWLPIFKTWRLNERMYGALTGMSKSMIKEQHGDAQFKKWRRSYATRPPPISSFSSQYPGNDERYVKNTLDIRFSVFESLVRSLSHRRLEFHRKFPKTESLKDCMSRTIPYFRDVIVPKSINKGKDVLISSSENAIRGLLMFLCEIPPDRINEVEIPTGLPIVYNLEKKCIQILDDGQTYENPLELFERVNFGTAPELLFRPCDLSEEGEEGGEEDTCFLYTNSEGKSFAYDPIYRLQDNKNNNNNNINNNNNNNKSEGKPMDKSESEKEREILEVGNLAGGDQGEEKS